MSSKLNSRVLSNTYKDDFADSDGYYRILFNSGRPLQARELTQMQTMLQQQITKFGNNIFKEGGVVKPGESVLNNSYEFAKLITTQYALPNGFGSLVGTVFTGNLSGVTARIIEVIDAEDGDPAAIYIAYTNAPTALAGATTVRFTPGETITNGATTLRVQETNTDNNPAVGRGVRYSIDAGVYFAKGFFVFTEKQSHIVSKFTDTVNKTVGYKIDETIATVDDDTGLYDNQGAVPNVSSPGADRLKITLTLTTQDKIISNENFIPLANITEGVISKVIDADNSYNVVNDFIATRIKENSGDYLVKPFKLTFEEDSDRDNLILNVSPGTAVIDGYRTKLYVPYTERITKPFSTAEIENEVTPVGFGNYVLVDAGTASNTKGLPDINTFAKLNIRSAAAHGGISIGTCRVRSVSEDVGNLYRFYLFDIQMNATKNFRDAMSVGTGVSDYFNLYRPSGKTELRDVRKNNLLFTLPQTRPKALDDITLQTQRRFQVTTSGTGTATISLTATGETFANENDWVVAKAGTNIITTGLTFSSSPAGQVAANFTGLPTSSTVEILAYVNKSIGVVRSKTLTETTLTKGPASADGSVGLEKPDIFKVLRIREDDSDGIDLRNRYEIDNGQRDNFYAHGKLKLKPGMSAPSTVFVRYQYFNHGANGDFFAINSYTGQIDYADIPSFRKTTGERINLRNVIDFRSVKDSDEDFITTSDGARIHELPQVNDTVVADVDYYLPQRGILTLNGEGDVQLRLGLPAFQPQPPYVPVGQMPLYNIELNANTLNDSDLSMSKIDHRRYTMKDIGKIEQRVDKIEELTALNLLEIDTKNFAVLDSNGLDRTKSGFFVDNFSTQLFSDLDVEDYRASIDPKLGFLAPQFNEDNIKLVYDSDASLNVVKKGDNIYLRHSEVSYAKQTQATKHIRINPFEAVVYHGDIELSPSSDEWREVNIRAKKIIDGGSKLDTKQAYLWNNWEWNWGGTSINDLQVGATTNKKDESTSSKIIANVNKVVSEETLLEVIDEKVIDIALIPFMRSKKVYFKAQGLRPSSKVWVYFGNTRIDDWVREETFTRVSDDPTDFGNKHNNATSHPEGITEILTDANGAVEGSFFIPNSSAQRFRTGSQQFKILDISADNEKVSGTIARALYTSSGYLDTIDQTIKSTRVLNVEHVRTTTKKYSGGGGGGGGGDDRSGPGYTSYDGGNTWSHNAPTDNYNYGFHDTGTSSSGGGGGGCFITTAIVERRGEADDGPTLTKLRKFRDEYMANKKVEVQEYYVIAPILVEAITDENEWQWIDDQIQKAVIYIDEKNYENAYTTYKDMVSILKNKYIDNTAEQR